MSDIERQHSNGEKSITKAHINDGMENEDPEYAEYLILAEEYTGEKMKKLTRQIDWRVIPQLIFIYMLSYIDRANVGNARLFGAQADTGLSNTDWNIGLSLLFITFACFGLPSNILVKKYGPRKVLPTLLMLVGIILIGTGCCSNRAAWFSLRLLLGVFEAGMYPGCTYTLTTWYTPAQIHSRTTIYYLGGVLSGAFSGLLAYGIGHLDYTWGYRGWRFIYIIEGLLTFVVGLIAIFTLQETPAKTKGWLTETDKRFLALRTRYMYGGGASKAKDEFVWADVVEAVKSVHTWILCLIAICNTMALYGFALSLPTIVLNMGFTAAAAQGLSAPPYVFASFCVVASGLFSDRYRMRAATVIFPSMVAFVGILICFLTVTRPKLVALSYVATCIAAGGLYCLTPALTVWIGLNSAGQTKRAAAISIVFFAAAIGGVPGSYIYIATEAPGYPTGFGTSLAVLGFGNVIVPTFYWWYCGRVNKKRDGMSKEQILANHSVEELAAMGDRSPLYKYER